MFVKVRDQGLLTLVEVVDDAGSSTVEDGTQLTPGCIQAGQLAELNQLIFGHETVLDDAS